MATMKPSYQPRITRGYTYWVNLDNVLHAIVAIQKWWKHWIQLKPQNTHDYITLEPVEPPIFLHVSDTRFVTAFSASTLANCFEASGDFKHPHSRTPFNVVEIRRLDAITNQEFKLCENYNSIIYRHQQEREQSLLQEFLVNELETQFQNCINSCISTLSDNQWDQEIGAQTTLFFSAFYSLYEVNMEMASFKMRRYIIRIREFIVEQYALPFQENRTPRVQIRFILLLQFIINIYTYFLLTTKKLVNIVGLAWGASAPDPNFLF